ncbi:MAG TPA: hypothetical protein VGQ90_08095 [Stellaceae bacterium]|jgi:hypothetical protein|nr:hypothetical protein [Stellaceae bacterium]
MTVRFGWCVALAVMAALVSGGVDSAGAAARRPAENSLNLVNDKLLKLAPAERAAELARAVGHWCIGTEAFLMGVVATGQGKGNAYWSLRCADGSTWAVQIEPFGDLTAIGCDTYKEVGAGKECFKTF